MRDQQAYGSAASVWQEVFVDTAKYVDWGLRVGCSALRVKTMFSQWGQKKKKDKYRTVTICVWSAQVATVATYCTIDTLNNNHHSACSTNCGQTLRYFVVVYSARSNTVVPYGTVRYGTARYLAHT